MSLAAASTIKRWRDDPVYFVKDVFGVVPDEWQEEYLYAYKNKIRVAAKSSKGPGKTAVLAWCCWHYLVTRPFPKVIATSISGDNLRDGLWSEMSKWQQKSKLLTAAFVWTKTRIYEKSHGETWFMSARQWSKSADKDQQANTLAGLHADYIMFVVDEAGGVPDAVVAAAEAALANAGTEVNPNAEAKLLLCGNPTHLTGPLYRACTKERSYWHVITITSDPDNPKRSKRVSLEWAKKQIDSYGRDNPWVMINVLGEFPPSSLNALLGPDDMERAQNRFATTEMFRESPKVLGADIGCEGPDPSIFFPRQGIVAFKPMVLRVPNLVQVAGRLAHSINKWQPDGVFVDSTGGFGASVVHNLNEWGHPAVGVHFSEKALDRQYANKRAEMAFALAQWIKTVGCLPQCPELSEEATAIEYYFKGDQVILIEKDQIKEKIGRSTDYWDALMLTFAYPVLRKDPLDKYRNPQDSTNYDPVQKNYKPPSVSDLYPKQGMDDYSPLK